MKDALIVTMEDKMLTYQGQHCNAMMDELIVTRGDKCWFTRAGIAMNDGLIVTIEDKMLTYQVHSSIAMKDGLIVAIVDKKLAYQAQYCHEGWTDCDNGG